MSKASNAIDQGHMIQIIYLRMLEGHQILLLLSVPWRAPGIT